MGTDPSRFKGDNLPVEQVSWNDAVEFCKKLSKKEGRTYRLPTEAEWEYACRAGTSTPFNTGLTISAAEANYDGDNAYGSGQEGIDRKGTTEVGSFAANSFGLYDMHGNVSEWCSDRVDGSYYSSSPSTDPTGSEMGDSRILRGGSWYYYPGICRSASRFRSRPDVRSSHIGFRIVVEDFE
jgi:formylglycine-generating enzyme required for sulfatase activity